MTDSTTPPPTGFWNVPNALTVGRLGLGVVVLILIGIEAYGLALGVFAIAAITDGLDGYLARRLGQATSLGRQLDPLVDKLLIAAVLIALVPIPGGGFASWMVAMIVARELLVQWLRSLMEGQGEAFGARFTGKLKTAVQCVAILVCLLALTFEALPPWLRGLRELSVWSALVLTIYSGVSYFLGAWPRLRATLS